MSSSLPPLLPKFWRAARAGGMQRQDAYDGNLGVRASVVPVHRLHQRSYRFAEHGSTKEDTSAKAAGEAALADADSVTPAVTPTKSGRGHNGRGGKHGGRGRGLLTREEVYGTPDSDADNVGASSPPSLDRPAVLRMIGHAVNGSLDLDLPTAEERQADRAAQLQRLRSLERQLFHTRLRPTGANRLAEASINASVTALESLAFVGARDRDRGRVAAQSKKEHLKAAQDRQSAHAREEERAFADVALMRAKEERDAAKHAYGIAETALKKTKEERDAAKHTYETAVNEAWEEASSLVRKAQEEVSLAKAETVFVDAQALVAESRAADMMAQAKHATKYATLIRAEATRVRHEAEERAKAANERSRQVQASMVAARDEATQAQASEAQAVEMLHKILARSEENPLKSSQASGTTHESECIVCMDTRPTHVFAPCGHYCVCEICCYEIMRTTRKCPLCRRAATLSMRVFGEESSDS